MTDEGNAREDAIEQLRDAERLSTGVTLASNFAHELGTPLNVVSGWAMMIASGEMTGQQAVDKAKIIVEQANKMTAFIQQMLSHARRNQPRKKPAHIRVAIDQTFSLLSGLAEKSKVVLRFDEASDDAVLEMDSAQLVLILMHLVTNAIKASSSGGEVTVSVKHDRQDSEANSGTAAAGAPLPRGTSFATPNTCISVRDAGCGIRQEDFQNIFKPFFKAKTESGGGLGLSIAKGIVREHGGRIDVESEVGVGSCFKVFLPGGGA